MTRDIHALVKDADHFDAVRLCAVENEMRSDRVFQVTTPYISFTALDTPFGEFSEGIEETLVILMRLLF